MSFNFGAFNEWSDPVTFADPVMASAAQMVKRSPYLGAFYQAMGAPSITIGTKTFDVADRTKTSRDGTIGTGGWDIDDITGLPIAAAVIKGLTIGHVLRIENEVVIVSGVDYDNATISVYQRGNAGTAATHAAGVAFKVLGGAGADTDLKNVKSMSESTYLYRNAVQTVLEAIDWTKHGELMRKGLSDANAVSLLVREAQERVADLLARMAILGYKYIPTSESGRYMSAGLIQQLLDTERKATNYGTTGVLSRQKMDDAIKSIILNGGAPTVIWCSPTNKTWVDNLLPTNTAVQIASTKDDHTAGGIYVTAYDYQGLVLPVRVDTDIPDDTIAIVNMDKCKKGWLDGDGLRLTDEPSLSSREMRKAIQGSVGFIVEDAATDHTLMTGITGGPTERIYKTQAAS